jgi:hypothetical protein
MIDFSNLQEVEAPVVKKEKSNRYGEYIIGFDPFEQAKEMEAGINVFTIFSRIEGRIIMRCRTKRNFDWFVEFVKSADIFKGMYSESRKFIKANGEPKTISEIRGI